MVALREVIDKAIENYLYEKEPETLYRAVKHLPSAGGKRLRPIIACLACEAVGGNVMDALPFGVALEIIHTFTLVHDDIMDRDEERRGKPSVHALFGDATAILAGDALFAKAFEIASYTRDDHVAKTILRNLAIMSKEICEGQQMDIAYAENDSIDEQQFMEVITKKTAKMFEHAAAGGALIGGGSEEQQEALREYGRNLGIAFQIWDDCLDVIGEDIGKPVGSDIREGKKTLLYLHAYTHADDREWLKCYGNPEASDEDIRKVVHLFEKVGSVAYAKEKAQGMAAAAKERLAAVPDGEAKDILMEMADFAVKREK